MQTPDAARRPSGPVPDLEAGPAVGPGAHPGPDLDAHLDARTADVVLLLAAASAGTNDRVAARMRADGIDEVRPHHGYLFQHLLPGPRTIRELSAMLGVTPQAVSKTVGEMEALGWVERAVGSTDLRTRHVSLTEAGHEVVRAGRRARAAVEDELRTALGDVGIADLRSALTATATLTGGWELLTRRALRPAGS